MDPSKILLIDDEAGILSSLERLLRKEDFEVRVTQNPHEAIDWFSKEEFAVVMSDQRMPEMNGTDLLEKLQTLNPHSIRILLTGYSDAQAAIDAINKGSVYRFLAKPWNDDELRQTLRQAVTQYEMRKENEQLQKVTQAQNAELEEMNRTLEQKVEERTKTITDLNQNLQKSLLTFVQVMAGLSEMHSGVIGSHSKRVMSLSKQIATKMSITSWDLLQIVIAATLHDIGKIGIPTDILQLESSMLSAKELELLRQHPIKGESILLKIENLENAAQIVRHHHENFNGTGYPDRLSGEDIPIGARIIAVVDMYDKILNQSTSYSSNTPSKAILLVKSHSSTMFDPQVVNILNSIISETPHLNEQTGNEVEIHPKDLSVGMVFSRDLVTIRGAQLLQKGQRLESVEQIDRILYFLDTDPVKEGIYIYRTPKN